MTSAEAANSPQPVEKASICITLITWAKQKVHRKIYMILPKPSLVGMPVAACRAEEQKAMPIRPGKPLRERFRQDEVFCFGQS